MPSAASIRNTANANCVDVANAVELRLGGYNAPGAPASAPKGLGGLTSKYGPFQKTNVATFEKFFNTAPDGTRGFLVLRQPTQVIINGKTEWIDGHVLNVIKSGGITWLLDGQTSTIFNLNSTAAARFISGVGTGLEFLRTR